MEIAKGNLIPNGDFSKGQLEQLPQGWELKTPYAALKPIFKLHMAEGKKTVAATGNGNVNCVGWISTSFQLQGGRTYCMRVHFRVSGGMDPHQNLLFSFYSPDFNNGIFNFKRLYDDWIEGENRFFVPGEGSITGEVRICFRLSPAGKAWIDNISLEECEAIPPRPVKVGCVKGKVGLDTWSRVLDYAGKENVDIFLLPETFNPGGKAETLDGPSGRLMSRKAKQYKMYVAGTFLYKDDEGFIYNSSMLYDPSGELIGRYDKNHPFSPEFIELGVIPGTDVPVFETDFGKIGMMICYDSWFTDVAELLALKGAEIILFPNAGYYRSLMPARAADNCVRFVVSSLDCDIGIWDTSGAEVTNPDIDPTRFANCDGTFNDVKIRYMEDVKILFATLDLSHSPSPHNWGGPMKSAPGGRRNRREQKRLLQDDIKDEICQWQHI